MVDIRYGKWIFVYYGFLFVIVRATDLIRIEQFSLWHRFKLYNI